MPDTKNPGGDGKIEDNVASLEAREEVMKRAYNRFADYVIARNLSAEAERRLWEEEAEPFVRGYLYGLADREEVDL